MVRARKRITEVREEKTLHTYIVNWPDLEAEVQNWKTDKTTMEFLCLLGAFQKFCV
jgi:hypothetical protein